MKYVIVSIYDCGLGTVCDCGKFISASNEYEKFRPINLEYIMNYMGEVFCKWLKERYSDYDLIVVCEDGDCVVVKDTTKESKDGK